MSLSPTYLTARDVESLVRVDRSTIYRMAETGRLPAIKVGRQWRFPADAVDKWLRASEKGPGQSPASSITQDIADLFADLYGVMVVVTDIAGNPITEVSNPCGYFSAVSGEADALDRCIAEWNTLGEEHDFEPRLRPSHLGFLCTRAFIRHGNELTGMIISGGIAPESWPPPQAEIERIATESRAPLSVIEQNIAEVHRATPDDQERLLAAVPILARHLAALTTRDRQNRDGRRRAP